MADTPWITIVGLGEDGPDGLSAASHEALKTAEIIMGAKRHLGLLPEVSGECIEWPVPFADGIPVLQSYHGRRVVVLASGDPFWFGVGSVIAREFASDTWRAIPAPSTFALAANNLGWPLEEIACLGLHAAPLTRLRPHLTQGARALVLLRDGAAVEALGHYLSKLGFGASTIHVLEALGGPCERVTTTRADSIDGPFEHPVCVGLSVAGTGKTVPASNGVPDDLFVTDGVMTKRPVRALTLSALAPQAGELLWDIGGGSGTVAIEWLLAHPACEAISVEARADRAALIRQNARDLGVDRLQVIEGTAPDALADLPRPAAVFIGGGLTPQLMECLETMLPAGTRLVANAVTLEAEALLAAWHAKHGGDLLRIEIAQAEPLGGKTGWKAGYPLVQWSGSL